MSRPFQLLLVEDDAEDALIFERHLPEGFQFTRVSDPTEAQQALATLRFDVVFIDYHLGIVSGLDYVQELREAGSSLAIVVISGMEIEALGENALLAGATDFITKDEICAASIQRVARWALVRQHVQSKLARQAPFHTGEKSRPSGEAPKNDCPLAKPRGAYP